MPMKNPPHPGEIVKDACLDALGLSVTRGAELLGVSRKTLSEVVNGKSGISAEMAVRLSKAFGSTPRLWLDMQSAYDLAKVEMSSIKVKRIKLPAQAEAGA